MGDIRATGRHRSAILSGVVAIRVAAAPLIVCTFLNNHTAWSLGIFLFAVATDALDGYLARRLGATPIPGPYSDAIADFLLVVAAFSAFVIQGIYPLWTVLLIVAMFTQFVLTSRLERPLYDPLGKYYGVFLFFAIGVTLALPDFAVCYATLASIVGLTVVSVASRSMFLLGLWKRGAPIHDSFNA